MAVLPYGPMAHGPGILAPVGRGAWHGPWSMVEANPQEYPPPSTPRSPPSPSQPPASSTVAHSPWPIHDPWPMAHRPVGGIRHAAGPATATPRLQPDTTARNSCVRFPCGPCQAAPAQHPRHRSRQAPSQGESPRSMDPLQGLVPHRLQGAHNQQGAHHGWLDGAAARNPEPQTAPPRQSAHDQQGAGDQQGAHHRWRGTRPMTDRAAPPQPRPPRSTCAPAEPKRCAPCPPTGARALRPS